MSVLSVTISFLDKEFRFESSVWYGCHDILMMSSDITSVTIFSVYGVVYRCIIFSISNGEATNLLKSAGLSENIESLQNIKNLFFIM